MEASRPAPPAPPPGLDGGLDRGDRKELARRADRELARRGGAGSFGYAGIALLLILVSSVQGAPSLVLYVVAARRIGVGAPRAHVSHAFERQSVSDSEGWRRKWAACTLGLGLAWGLLAGNTIGTLGLRWSSLLVILSVSGISAGALTNMATHQRIFRQFLILLLGPTILGFLLPGKGASWSIGLTFAAYGAYLVVEGSRLQAQLREAGRSQWLTERRTREPETARVRFSM